MADILQTIFSIFGTWIFIFWLKFYCSLSNKFPDFYDDYWHCNTVLLQYYTPGRLPNLPTRVMSARPYNRQSESWLTIWLPTKSPNLPQTHLCMVSNTIILRRLVLRTMSAMQQSRALQMSYSVHIIHKHWPSSSVLRYWVVNFIGIHTRAVHILSCLWEVLGGIGAWHDMGHSYYSTVFQNTVHSRYHAVFFSPKNSEGTPHSSSVKAMHGCLLWNHSLNKALAFFLWHCGQYRVHDDVIKWKHFPRNWPFVRGIHRSPVNSPHKGQWRGALMFSLICVWINDWVV